MDKREVKQLLALVVAAYPQFEATPERARLWSEMLADVSSGTAFASVRRHIRESRYPPTIAEIRGDDNYYPRLQTPEEVLGGGVTPQS